MSLTQQLKQGNQLALKELYERLHARLYHFAMKYTRDAMRSEDLVHQIFLHIWEKKDRLSVEKPIEAQVFVIARNIIINDYRRRVTEAKANQAWKAEADAAEAPAEAAGDPDEVMRTIQSAIDHLPPRRREIFMLAKMEGFTYEEIACELDISRNTVEVHMTKALKYLREHLGQFASFFF